MSVSTHVLDAVAGRPAVGVRVVLERRTDQGWDERAARDTDEDGRVADLAAAAEAGVYRLRFDVDAGARAQGHQRRQGVLAAHVAG